MSALRVFCHLLVLVAVAFAAPTSAMAEQPGASIVSFFDVEAPGGVSYRIFTAVPEGEAPEDGFPVVYLIDGNMVFPMAEKTMSESAGMRAVLVGIGYPVEEREQIVSLRYFDLTPDTAAELIPLAEGASPPRTGGRDAFLAFIEDELKPEIERRFSVNPARQTLFGHSLGGLFTLHVLYNRPDAFQTYIAADPSIWWNGRAILEEQNLFLRDRADGISDKRLLIETSGRKPLRPGTDAANAQKLKKLRSGPNGRDVYEVLQSIPGLTTAFRSFPDESHGSMVPLTVTDALRFSLFGEKPADQDVRSQTSGTPNP